MLFSKVHISLLSQASNNPQFLKWGRKNFKNPPSLRFPHHQKNITCFSLIQFSSLGASSIRAKLMNRREDNGSLWKILSRRDEMMCLLLGRSHTHIFLPKVFCVNLMLFENVLCDEYVYVHFISYMWAFACCWVIKPKTKVMREISRSRRKTVLQKRRVATVCHAIRRLPFTL